MSGQQAIEELLKAQRTGSSVAPEVRPSVALRLSLLRRREQDGCIAGTNFAGGDSRNVFCTSHLWQSHPRPLSSYLPPISSHLP